MPESFETPWYEFCPQIKAFHEAMTGIYGEGKGRHAKGWTRIDTARHFEIGISTTSENLRLADALEAGIVHPNMSRDQARKTVLNYKVKVRAWSVKKLDKNEFYLRDDTNYPYLFTLKLQAEAFCEVVKNVEPVAVDIIMLRDKDLEKENENQPDQT